MNNGSELIDILLKKHNLDYDDIHDVRTLADILADMVPAWKNVDACRDELEDHYFYLVLHKRFGTPMKAKYHDDMGGYFEIVSALPNEIGWIDNVFIDPLFGERNIDWFMEMPEAGFDYGYHPIPQCFKPLD